LFGDTSQKNFVSKKGRVRDRKEREDDKREWRKRGGKKTHLI